MNPDSEEKHTTSLTLPKSLFLLLKQDAERCHRSMAGQVAAILSTIYLQQDVAIHNTERYTPSIELPERKVKAA